MGSKAQLLYFVLEVYTSTMSKTMIDKKYLFLIAVMTLVQSAIFATGPSWIESKIRPISINEKGEILCRTRFSKNETGGHTVMKVVYGYCVISADTIIQYKTQEIEPEGFPPSELNTLNETIAFWDAIYNSCFDKDNLCEIGYKIRNQYHFDSCNVASYKVDKLIKMTDFEKNKTIDVERKPQKALNGALSTAYYEEKMLRVLYDFGNTVILENVNNEVDEIQIGADFDYFNGWTNEVGETKNIGFDNSEVTGILRWK